MQMKPIFVRISNDKALYIAENNTAWIFYNTKWLLDNNA